EIVLPQKLDHPFVGWAMQAQLWQVLEKGCRVFMTPPPFDHSKLFVVDEIWTLIGSSNWDPRSLRLNFELGVETWDRELAARIGALIDAKRNQGREITLAMMDGRSVPVRLRDGIARLFSPYL
ncbi:MAG TPA: phospholipase D-like domain-containing protein, partial [Thermoanaerobaculia bacterium]|nr:phospholipase D-like domain-containing protein [Thermoanaerobaculia bacterium]